MQAITTVFGPSSDGPLMNVQAFIFRYTTVDGGVMFTSGMPAVVHVENCTGVQLGLFASAIFAESGGAALMTVFVE